jgi:hypothetical protein
MTHRYVKELIKILSSKDLDFRPALQQVFACNNKLYATDGYIAIEILESDNVAGKCMTLQQLKVWEATHPDKNDMVSADDLQPLEDSMPDMEKLLSGNFEKPCRVALDIKKLKQCCDFLKCTQFEVKQNSNNENLYQIIPIGDGRSILEKAFDSKVYLMGVCP